MQLRRSGAGALIALGNPYSPSWIFLLLSLPSFVNLGGTPWGGSRFLHLRERDNHGSECVRKAHAQTRLTYPRGPLSL